MMEHAAPSREGISVATHSSHRREGHQSLRLLISSAGRRVGRMQCFRQAADQIGIDLEVIACDLRPELSAACQLADKAFGVPPATDSGYINALLSICQRQRVDLLVPTIDTELPALAHARDAFAGVGTSVAISDPALVDIARDKLATSRHFADHHIPSPDTRTLEDVLANGWPGEWPVIVKPQGGSASRAISSAHAQADLPRDWAEPMVVQRLLTGKEYTINLYFDAQGTMRCAIPHERIQVRAGEVEKGVTRRIDSLDVIIGRLPHALAGARGALCAQAIVDDEGHAALFEINARFGGGYPLAHHAGADFARWLLEARLGLPSTANDHWREGVTILRYDAAVLLG
jgi:carbamoyl-phosphate synthase large subunit